MVDAVEHCVGLQAQNPLDPYEGLRARLAGFEPDQLAARLEDRAVVRIVIMRGTVHLVSARDCLALRPLFQPVLDGEMRRHQDHKDELAGLDLGPVLAFAEPFLSAAPRTGPELRDALAEAFPQLDPAALAFACRNRLALVQVPPRGVWGRGGQVTLMTAEAWLGADQAGEPSLPDLVLRYLRAFGPSTAADLATWTRLTGLRPVIESLRPQLRSFRNERGQELLDVEDAPRPAADTPAPPRLLPEYDNALLAHKDRGRFQWPGSPVAPLFVSPGRAPGAVLVDGLVRGAWRRDGDDLVVIHLGDLGRGEADALDAEANHVRTMLADRRAGSVRRQRWDP